jgi:hypothetical protein
VPFSPETIGRHERGDIPLSPEDALIYAEHYESDDIPIRYCAGCPIGRTSGRAATDRDLPYVTLRLTYRLRVAAKEIAPTLESIAYDGIVAEGKRPIFIASIISLKELGENITDIMLYAAANGIKKEPPCKQKRPPTNNILSPVALSVNHES